MLYSIEVISQKEIENRIFLIRGIYVMFDYHLAEMYSVEIKRLNEQVKRNSERFPPEFMFQITTEEYESLRSQFATLKIQRGQHRKYLPYVFTEQGVAMLSAVLHSKVAIKMSVIIMNSFVEMRKAIQGKNELSQRVEILELKQNEVEQKFEQVFKALEKNSKSIDKGIFFEGQIFDAYVFISTIIKKAKKSIYIIDNYIDESVLLLLSKRQKGIQVVIYINQLNKQLELDLKKYHDQYSPISIKIFKNSHDRFIIVDEENVYHVGASIKDLGKKWVAISKMDSFIDEILSRLIS